MAGAGFKTFNTGDVLTSSDVNTYLMQQTVMVFDDASARSTALTGVVAEGMLSYLKDTNAVQVYDGSSWVASDDPNAIQNSIVDAKGDLISATADNTPARLAVGADNTVLTADSSTATGLKWAAAAAGGGDFTLITRNTFSNTGSVILDGVFTSSYRIYCVVIESIYAVTANDNLQLQLRYGSTTQTANYQGASVRILYNSTTVNSDQSGTTSEYTINNDTGSSTYPSSYTLWFNGVGHGSDRPRWNGTGVNAEGSYIAWNGGWNTLAETYTGFLLKSGSSNITGVVAVYGLAAA